MSAATIGVERAGERTSVTAPPRSARQSAARESEELVLSNVTSQRVREATGRGWAEWLTLLDDEGAAAMRHSALVAHLGSRHSEVPTSWWRQAVTVGYEQARGRAVGATDRGFQVGVQRTATAPPADVWRVVTERPELWLGTVPTLERGARYTSDTGATGEIRVVRPGERLRLTWRPAGWATAATVQLTLLPAANGRTALHVLVEKLPDAEARERTRAHWRAVLERVIHAAAR